ncbi:tyrosine-type recombinase/integrase [Fluviispira vulneris]|uniref:tyrosine-type recombinase/integrase n=1 Tax=Fluviispira vulneris TaxID=2763012 RepID=UPI001644AF26|nr:site-specific integrase [Fluviispira vulneris]
MDLFCDYVTEWIGSLNERYSAQTIRSYSRIARKHFKHFAEMQLENVSPALLLKYLVIKATQDKRKFKTTKNILSTFSAYCDFLLCRGLIEKNPCVDETLLSRLRAHYRTARDKVQKRMYALSVPHAVLLLQRAYCKGYQFGLATETLLCTGLRLGELAGLEINDVSLTHIVVCRAFDPEGKQMQMSAKWGSNGSVPIPAHLGEKLELFFKSRKRAGDESTCAFPYVRARADVFSKRIGKISDDLGLPHTTAHVLRRTALTWLVAEGIPLAVVQAVARHSTSAMTEKYIDKRQVDSTGATEAIARRLGSDRRLTAVGGD